MKLVSVGSAASRLARQGVEREFLPAALEVMDTPASPAARYTAFTVASLLTIAVVWSVLARIIHDG